MSDDSETIELLAGLRRGDREQAGRLAALVWERMYPFVWRTTLDRDATEDILQETLLTMLGRAHALRDDSRFWPWIYRIAWSRIQDRFRSRRVHSTCTAVMMSEATAAPSESPLDAQIRDETLRQVSQALARLSDNQRDVLHLRCYEQLPYPEIASRTHTTPARARVHFHRAKKSLRKQLACCL